MVKKLMDLVRNAVQVTSNIKKGVSPAFPADQVNVDKMFTLIICRDYRRSKDIANEFDIDQNSYRYLPSGISTKDILNHRGVMGNAFDRIIYDKKPSDDALAYLSISMRDGAIMTNYNNYKLSRILRQL